MTAKQEPEREDCDGSCDECDDVGECALTELINDVPLARQPVEHPDEDPEASLPNLPDEYIAALQKFTDDKAACDAACTKCHGAGECNLDDQQHELVPEPNIWDKLNKIVHDALEAISNAFSVAGGWAAQTYVGPVLELAPSEPKRPGDEGFLWPCPSDEGCLHCADGAECNDMRDPDDNEDDDWMDHIVPDGCDGTFLWTPTLYVQINRTVGDQDVVEYRLASTSEILVAAARALMEEQAKRAEEVLNPC